MDSSFHGQIAIVTGAASGLGSAIALKLHEKGVKLVLFDKDNKGLEKINLQCNNELQVREIDITNEASVKNLVDIVGQQHGRIDILVNCAGITGKTNIKSHEVSSSDLKGVFEVNFMGSFYTSRHILPWMLRNNYGRILHIASIAGKEGNAGMLAYSASKAAVIGMTKVQGKEYAETGITINALAPAVIKTPLLNDMPEEQVKYMTDKIPMKRCGTLKEVTDAALFIISPENSFTTGFTFDLSGGRATY